MNTFFLKPIHVKIYLWAPKKSFEITAAASRQEWAELPLQLLKQFHNSRFLQNKKNLKMFLWTFRLQFWQPPTKLSAESPENCCSIAIFFPFFVQ